MAKYICPVCGGAHVTKVERSECKKSHKEIESVKNIQYSKYERFPNKLSVMFADGVVVTYRRG